MGPGRPALAPIPLFGDILEAHDVPEEAPREDQCQHTWIEGICLLAPVEVEDAGFLSNGG